MYCTKCGNQNTTDAKFCKSCGAKIGKEAKKTEIDETKPPETTRFAGFWTRVGAYLIDGGAVALANTVLTFLFVALFGKFLVSPVFLIFFLTGGISLVWILVYAISSLYFIYFWVKNKGQTPGDRLLAIAVERVDEKPLTVPTALLRYIGYALSGIAFGLGFLWCIWDKDRQGWQDKLAKTVVVKTKGKQQTGLAIGILIVEFILIYFLNTLLSSYSFSLFSQALGTKNTSLLPPNTTQPYQYYPSQEPLPTDTPMVPQSPTGPQDTTMRVYTGLPCDESKTEVINISQRIQNDIDHSDQTNAYWAFDNYTRYIRVWQDGDNSYCAEVAQVGTFQALQGARSPGATGTLTGEENGTIVANERILLTGTLDPNAIWETQGTLTPLNFNCDAQGNCPGAVTWQSVYFPYSKQTTNWAKWVYINDAHTWTDSTNGSTGDVI